MALADALKVKSAEHAFFSKSIQKTSSHQATSSTFSKDVVQPAPLEVGPSAKNAQILFKCEQMIAR